MNILIDNKDLKTHYGIDVLNYAGALGFPAEREDERQWNDKSGVDKNLSNIRYDSKEFVFNCVCKASTEVAAYNIVNTLVSYMFEKGVFVLSLRDTTRNIREAFICERSDTIVANIHVRPQNGLYSFKIGLKDINPNAVKYYETIAGNSVSIDYTKGQSAVLYWGNGDREEVSNSGTYNKSDYSADGLVDVFIDIDKDANIVSQLTANFTANSVSGIKPFEVTFTDTSIGDIVIWSWDFGDGGTSSEQNPVHTYTTAGTYTVTLQIFNTAQGVDTEIKENYVTLRDARMLINDAGDFTLINATDHTLTN